MRKTIARLLACALCIGIMSGRANAEPIQENHWARTTVANCVELDLLQEEDLEWYGQPVKPDQFYTMLETVLGIDIQTRTAKPKLTRLETAEILANILAPLDKNQNPFETCRQYSILQGYPDGHPHPDEAVTNAQACAVIVRMIKALDEITPEIPKTDKALANGKPIDYENVWDIIKDFKANYPTGTLWSYSDMVGTEYYHDAPDPSDPNRDVSAMNAGMPNAQTHTPTSLKYGCGGFSCQLSDALFGTTGFPCHEVFDTNRVLPGDIVYFTDDDDYVYHIATVYKLYRIGTKTWFQTAAANEYDQVRFSDDVEKSFYQVGKTCRVFSRYPTER